MSLVHNLRLIVAQLQKPDTNEGNLFYNKYKFKKFLSDHNIRTPKTYHFITDPDKVPNKFPDEFVLKPNNASSGTDVYVLKRINDHEYQEIDGRIHQDVFVQGKIKNILSIQRANGVIVEELIRNPEELKVLLGESKGIIDLRFYVLFNNILYGKLRIPNSKSKGYANTGRKATAMFVDENGIIGKRNIFRNTTTNHPDIKRSFNKMKVPLWDEFSRTALNVTKLFNLKFHSVDVTIDDQGKGCVCESECIPYLGYYTDPGCLDLMNRIIKYRDS